MYHHNVQWTWRRPRLAAAALLGVVALCAQQGDVPDLKTLVETGGGLPENLPRILPETCNARIDKGTWPVPPVFAFLQEKGGVEEAEMFRVFNMGLGMVLVVAAPDRDKVTACAPDAHVIGEIVKGDGKVTLV